MPLLNQLRIFFSFLISASKSDKNVKRYFIFGTAITLLISCLTLLLPLIFSLLIQNLSNVENYYSIPLVIITYGFLWTSTQLIMQLRFMILAYVIEDAIGLLSLTFLKHLHSLSMRFHLDRNSGTILHTIESAQNGFELIIFNIQLFLMPLCIELISLFIIIGYLFGLQYIIFFIIAISFFIVINLFPLKKLEQAYKDYHEKRSITSGVFMDNLINIETVKYFSNYKFDYDQYNKLVTEQKKASLKKQHIESLSNIMQTMFIGAVFICITYMSGKYVMQGMSISRFILINGYFLQFILPLQHIIFAIQQLQKGLQQLVKMQEILDNKPEIIDHIDAINLEEQSITIDFNNVSFGYSTENIILNNISFSIPAGKTVAIVGPSGSGKSTIIRLLFRFFDVSSGSITMNGKDIRLLTQESLRRTLGVVPQDIVLFNRTLKYNIAYGNINADEVEIHEVTQQAKLESLIYKLPLGYNTIVGERGLKLSGGEKQRIGISRVLLKKPKIYVFDEATSALDTKTEYEIQQTIRQISVRTTTLIIAHRLSTILHADSIIVLDNGTISEQGSHSQLLNQNGLYSKLWKEQSKQV